MNDLFPIALQFRLLSVWNIIQLRMSIFTLHVVFPLVPIQKCRVLCDNCLVYGTSLVSNNYLGSNKCSVDNHFHFSSEWLVSYSLLFRLLSVSNIIQFRMSIFSRLLVPIQKIRVLCDHCLVYRPLSSFQQLSPEKLCCLDYCLCQTLRDTSHFSCVHYISSFQQLSRFKQVFCW